jgi:hypothetical protein
MTDETENVEAGSETSGDTAAAEASQETTVAAETTEASTEKSEETPASAEVAAEPKAGDTCTCPDGRTGTLHSFDEGLICLPNQG